MASSHEVQPPCLTVPRTLIWVDSIRTPPWLSCRSSPGASLSMFYCTLCIYCVLFLLCNDYSFILFCNDLTLHCSILLFKYSSNFLFRLMLDFSGYGSLFWYWMCIPGILILKTQNKKTLPITIKYSRLNIHHTSEGLPTLVLASGVAQAYCHNRCYLGIRD
jgi:hypothetical protein